MVTPPRKLCKLDETLASEKKASEPNANQFRPVPGKSSGDIVTAAAAPMQRVRRGDEKAKAKAKVLKKSVSMKDDKGGAKHGADGWWNGEGGIMRRNLVYNRAYKRARSAELRKGNTDAEAKQVASENGRQAVEFFLDRGSDID